MFTEEPKTVEVTEEQLQAIKNDPVLKILKDKPEEEKAPEITDDPAVVWTGQQEEPKTVEGGQTTETADQTKTAEATNTTAPEAKPISRMNKDELVAGLVAKGLKPDVDFDPDANNKDLAELLAAS